MKIFITGANGFTGSHLVKALENQGHTIKCLVRKTSNLSRLNNCKVELIYGEITDYEIITKAMEGVDIVFHLAAYVELGLVNAAEMEKVNVEGTRTILEIAKAASISKIIYCSTIGIYGNSFGKVINETFQRQQINFSSAYDRTKYLGQQLVNQFVKAGLPVVSIMPSGIFGIDDPHFGPVMQLFLQKKLKFWVGGDRLTGIVHVDDLVTAMILAVEKSPAGEHYIISAGELKTREMFAFLSQETGIPIPLELPEPIVRVIGNLLDLIGRTFAWNPPLSNERIHYLYDRCVRVDSTKARQQLGWQPRSINETLRSLLSIK
ncbi:NAD-dependent epimerase/dehydratase family protein [Anabaena sp. UHCC 0204]|uniref:NAD-dependent epimerase/dehydratase family protein n=1 Tax=Anabaena sp. UHCC 0204 TaxID=2590009 RepID=UPI001447EDF7|nr:NAD-dependent epimerase/dehydratase family protein [Anabaena sp. UHCC 0204]MTJ07104.1 NAD-dependent epimerase/dehydratase family protein [Anabaena sp. UHCC 0204]